MVDPTRKPVKNPRLVGGFIRTRREALSLSQRALGQLFKPAVTTQFISNVERGVTPLPPSHVPMLASALKVSEEELMNLLEREYAAKLSGRLGRAALNAPAGGDGKTQIIVSPGDYSFMRRLYDAYSRVDEKSRRAFVTVCESMLNLPRGSDGEGGAGGA